MYRRAGLFLPRVAREQFAATGRLSPDDVLPGDLLFFSMKHPGGPLSVPYIVPDGSELVLYVLDQEVDREKAVAVR